MGIVTGDGNNQIINTGSIDVVARVTNPDSALAAGILTGSGNDVVINNGTISALYQTHDGTVLGHGVGIDTGLFRHWAGLLWGLR